MRQRASAIIAIAVACGSLSGCQRPESRQAKEQSVVFLSEPYTIDRIYPSMTGPQTANEVRLVAVDLFDGFLPARR